MIYLGYVQGGKCRDTHAPMRDQDGEKIKQPNIWKQFWVIDELASMGIDAWCGKRIDFKRSGKDRFAEAHESPFLPNYVFIEMTDEQFIKAIGVKFLASGFKIVPKADIAALDAFKSAVGSRYMAAQRVEANSQAAIAEYTKGQQIEAISGPFAQFPMWFERIVKRDHDKWPRIEGKVDMMGAMVTVHLDPLDVRSA
tara:strand:+ start:7458 stop:8048 length:591 start_codon:yes stop_codon:yes gene_type:complete